MTRAFVDDIPNDLDDIVSYVEQLRDAILKVSQNFVEVMKENVAL